MAPSRKRSAPRDGSEPARPAKQPRTVKAGACDACKAKKKSCKRPGDDRSVQCEYCTKTNQVCVVSIRDKRETTSNKDKLLALLGAFKKANAEYRTLFRVYTGEIPAEQTKVGEARNLIASGRSTPLNVLDVVLCSGIDWVSASPDLHLPLFVSEIPKDMAKSTLPQIRKWGEQFRGNAYPHIERLHRLMLRVCRGQCQELNLSETLASDEVLLKATDGYPLVEGDLAAVQGYKETLEYIPLPTPPLSPSSPNDAAAPAATPSPAEPVPASFSAPEPVHDNFAACLASPTVETVFAPEFESQTKELIETAAREGYSFDASADIDWSRVPCTEPTDILTTESAPRAPTGLRKIDLEQVDPLLLGNHSPESFTESSQGDVLWYRRSKQATATPWDGNNVLRWSQPTAPPHFGLASPTPPVIKTFSPAAYWVE